MSQVIDAARTFFDQLASVGWTMLAIGLAMHFARLLCRAVAWRNILAASFPTVRVRRMPVFGAYVLVHGRIEGSTYSTLTPTLIVETLFDLVVAAMVLIWAFARGVLPGLDVLRGPKLRSRSILTPLRTSSCSRVMTRSPISMRTTRRWFRTTTTSRPGSP